MGGNTLVRGNILTCDGGGKQRSVEPEPWSAKAAKSHEISCSGNLMLKDKTLTDW